MTSSYVIIVCSVWSEKIFHCGTGAFETCSCSQGALRVLSHLKIRFKRWLLRSASLAVTVPLSRNWNTNHGRWSVHLHALSPHVSVRKFQTIQLKYQRITAKWGPHEQSLSQTIGCGLSKCSDAPSETSGLACSWHLQTAHRSWNANCSRKFHHRWMNLWCIKCITHARGFWLQEQVQWTPLSPKSNQPSVDYFSQGWFFSCSLCRVKLNS